jgi:hypothetical protein
MKINAGPSGREVISLQKMDSLLVSKTKHPNLDKCLIFNLRKS